MYLEKAGCPWRFLPKELGRWQTVRTWHNRFRADGIYVGPRIAQASQHHGADVQVTTRERDEASFRPLPLRWRIEATFGTLSNR